MFIKRFRNRTKIKWPYCLLMFVLACAVILGGCSKDPSVSVTAPSYSTACEASSTGKTCYESYFGQGSCGTLTLCADSNYNGYYETPDGKQFCFDSITLTEASEDVAAYCLSS